MTIASLASLIERARATRIEDEIAARGIKLVGRIDRCGPCPVSGGRDRFSINIRKQVFNCRICGASGDVIDLVMHVDGVDFRTAIETLAGERAIENKPRLRVIAPPRSDDNAIRERDRAIARRIAGEIVPLIGTPGEVYLAETRKIDVAAIEDVLSRRDAIGWHPGVYFSEMGQALHAQRLGCIVGVMTDAVTSEPTGAISRTYPARRIEKFGESARERFLSTEEFERLGAALREVESTGVPWTVDESRPNAKHVPKERRITVVSPFACAAIRLLIFTGCRLREILDLEWRFVDFERGLLNLPTSKTGRKSVVLGAPALAILAALPRLGAYVIAGDDPAKPRADLQRPWGAVCRRAGLEGLRLHDLRHSFASTGVSAGMGLPIVGKLLGHASPGTTARYAHLDADPVRKAANAIGATIAAAMDRKSFENVVPLAKATG